MIMAFLRRPLAQRNRVAVAVTGLVVIVAVALLAFNVGSLPLAGGSTTYTAYFTEDAGLAGGNQVRVAGVTVGKVTGIALDGARVKVTFTVSRSTWVGNESTAAIDIQTLLGTKYLGLNPLGSASQDPGQPIPLARTTSPYDVTQAFNQLGAVFQQLNTAGVAKSLQTIATTFANTPPAVHQALTGLSALSQTVASQDSQLASLLAGTNQITGTLARDNSEFTALINDGSLLLSELQSQQQAIGSLLTGTEALATQLSTLVNDDNAELGPLLDKLGQVTGVLQSNSAALNKALSLAGVYTRLTGNVVGNGRWFDVYLCGLVPQSYGGTQPSSGCEPSPPNSPSPQGGG